MINNLEILETLEMIGEHHLDVRTITMGISLFDCVSDDPDKAADKVYKKIVSSAKDLVKVGGEIAGMYGVPIVNKRVSVSPIALIGASSRGFEKMRSLWTGRPRR
jgi:Uncharacterized conserved protein